MAMKFPVMSAEDIAFDDGDESFMELLNSEAFGYNPDTAAHAVNDFQREFAEAEPSPPSDDTQSRGSTPQQYMELPSPGTCSNEENGSTSGDSEGGRTSSPLSKPRLYGHPPAPLDPKEDKKRRNRLAAKMSRAKKKRVMQSIEERQEYLEQERMALKKENEELRNTNRALENQLAFFHGIFKANTDSKFKLPDGISFYDKPGATQSDSSKTTAPNTGLAMGFVFLAVFSAGRMDDFAPSIESLMEPEPRRAGRTLMSIEEDPLDFPDMNALMPSLGIAHATAMAAGLAVVAYLLIWAYKTYITWMCTQATSRGFIGDPARMTKTSGKCAGDWPAEEGCGAKRNAGAAAEHAEEVKAS